MQNKPKKMKVLVLECDNEMINKCKTQGIYLVVFIHCVFFSEPIKNSSFIVTMR